MTQYDKTHSCVQHLYMHVNRRKTSELYCCVRRMQCCPQYCRHRSIHYTSL